MVEPTCRDHAINNIMEETAITTYQSLLEVLDRISDGFFAVDRQWQISFVNRTLENSLHIRREDYLHRNLWDCYPHLKGMEFERQFHNAMRNNSTVKFEHLAHTNQRWYEITAHPSGSGLSVFLQDISNRKKAEEELRMLSLVAKETHDAVILLNLDSKITWVNAAFTRMTGYRFEEAVGQKPSDLLQSGIASPETLRYINERQQQNLPVQVEIQNFRKNGEPFWSDVYIQPLFDAEGNVEQFFSIRKEITQRKELEQQLEQQRKNTNAAVIEAQERERAEVGRELHDNVNQVLTSVKLYLELLSLEIGDRETLLQKSMQLLQQSIDENRSLSRRLSPPTRNGMKLSDSMQELVDTVAVTRKFEITLRASTICDLQVSEELHVALYRILQEQLTNITRHAKASLVHVAVIQEGDRLLLNVTDNGRGFDTSQKRTGIGITNMRMRAENLGGTLAIRSRPGQGCILLATFPINENTKGS